ncbi:MAG: amidohydrolase family protein [Phycisphaerales bacterium]|nr:MAG: amidohydrolase family protein [Phycisphaerales bacterium]
MKVPGLVDLQVNGYKGVDFSSLDLTEADFARACRQLLEAGTTAFLPTMITSPVETYEHNLAIMADVLARGEFQGRLLGIHLEGPFISAQEGARGAHNAEYVREPDVGLLEELIDWAENRIRLITVAADVKGADHLASCATSKGIAVSLGHQMATEQDLERLVQAGAVSLTHLGNGIPAMLSRHRNPVWAGLANDDLLAMIIADGHHLPASMLKTIIRTKGPQRCVVVSDSAPLAGFKPGSYETMGHKVVLEEDGRLHDPVTGYFVGSSATILECMNHLAPLDLASPTELIAMGFYNPLRLIGLGAADVAPVRDISFDRKRNRFYLLQ